MDRRRPVAVRLVPRHRARDPSRPTVELAVRQRLSTCPTSGTSWPRSSPSTPTARRSSRACSPPRSSRFAVPWSGSSSAPLVGLGLAIVLVHVRILERSLVPLIVASQTIPIVAIAPVVVVGLKAGWLGIAIVASYLTFFPVTIAAIRGMRSADPRAFELMRAYAASDRTRPLEAAAAGVGAVPVHRVQDLGHGLRGGGDRGRAAVRHSRWSGRDAAQLDAVLLDPARAFVGRPRRLGRPRVACFVLVVAAERWALRDYRPTEAGAAS